jgi:arylsulfatase A-like enzyme
MPALSESDSTGGPLLGVNQSWLGNSVWQAFRVPAMVRWPGHIKPGSVSNEIFSGHDWIPTLLAVAGDAEVKDRLAKGWQVGDRTYKVHLDSYNQLHTRPAGRTNRSVRASSTSMTTVTSSRYATATGSTSLPS